MSDDGAGQGRPLGAPISTYVLVPGTRAFDAVRETLDAIDAVHGDGQLPEVPVRAATGQVEVGTYEWDDRTGRPRSLAFSRRSPHPHLTVAHEVGHFLDHQALGPPGRFASEHERIPEVLDAIGRTDAARGRSSLRGRPSALVRLPDGRRWRMPVDRRRVVYLSQPAEVFARAYAQYVALRSQHPTMLRELDQTRGAVLSGLVYHDQWADSDFHPVAEELDRLFRAKGWAQ